MNRLSRNEVVFAGIPKDSSKYFSEIRKNKGVFYSKLEKKYKGVEYHKNKPNGRKNPAPLNGSLALKKSIQIKKTSSRRISTEGNSFVIFDETTVGVFHGHKRGWEELTQEMQSILIKNGFTNRKGKILK